MTSKVDKSRTRLPQVTGYRTESVLGEGGMANVYLAVQESLSRHVALKVMNQLLTVDADFCRRFLNEGRLVAKLSHPNIVTVYDIGVSANVHYLSMTYLPGGTLKDRLAEGLSLDQAVYILKCLADALGYAHRHGIVHRDLKPGNVLFTDSRIPILTDFGIAKTVGNETRLTSTGMMLGSVGYMSPEQTAGQEVDYRSDLYSLGVLFWQMLTGSLPYSAPDPFALALKHAHEPIPQLPQELHRFQPVIEGLLAKKPDERVASTEDLLRILDAIPPEPIAAATSLPSDETVVVSRGAEPLPNGSRRRPKPHAQPPTTPQRRARLVPAIIAVAGAGALAGVLAYLGLFSAAPDPIRPSSSDALDRISPAKDASLPQDKTLGQEGSQASDGRDAPAALVPKDPRPSDALDTSTTRPSFGGSLSTTGPEDQRRIDQLLRIADDQWKAGRLTTPPGDNAFETYSRVLELAPEQLEAKEGLVRIGRINAANKVFESAESLLRQGNIDDARRLIETGLKMSPKDERLLGLQRAIDY